MVRFYYYKHSETGEIYSDQRMDGFEKKPLIVKGAKCELVPDYVPPIKEHKPLGPRRLYKDGQREVWEADPQYVKKCNPRFVKHQSGFIERYDSSKHC